MTVLARLCDKGVVTRWRAGRAFAYQAVIDEDEITARQMRRLLDARDDRAAVLSRFVHPSADDERLLAVCRGAPSRPATGTTPDERAVAVPLAVSPLFAATAPTLGRRMPPAPATRVLVVGSLAVTASGSWCSPSSRSPGSARSPTSPPWARGPRRAASGRSHPRSAAIGAALLLPLLAAQASWWVVRRCWALLAVQQSCRHLPTLTRGRRRSDWPDAFTTPHRRGRIVVTTGLLRALARGTPSGAGA